MTRWSMPFSTSSRMVEQRYDVSRDTGTRGGAAEEVGSAGRRRRA